MHHNHGTVLRIRRTVHDQKIAEVDAGILHCIVLGNAEDGFFRISDQTCGQRILFCGIEIRADGCQRSKGFWFFCRKQIILALDNLFSDPGRTSELMQFFYQSCRLKTIVVTLEVPAYGPGFLPEPARLPPQPCFFVTVVGDSFIM